jgi:hypothetical protein
LQVDFANTILVIKLILKELENIMSELTCKVSSCSYNKDTACSKDDITVGGRNACESDGTCCESFHQRGTEASSSTDSNPSHSTSIDCEAVKCQHNTANHCDSEHVDINGKNACTCGETVCATFAER